MRLLFTLDRQDYDPEGEAFVRPSVRAILIRDGKVAMVHSRTYHYYKFPGGGMEPGESQLETLIRETQEESGLRILPETVRPYGWVHRVEKGDREPRFIQDNYYYLCGFADGPGGQRLDDYEREAGFCLRFTDPREAIAVNRGADHGGTDQTMLEREARVLELLLAEKYL